jgi:hypothetical protein
VSCFAEFFAIFWLFIRFGSAGVSALIGFVKIKKKHYSQMTLLAFNFNQLTSLQSKHQMTLQSKLQES